MFCAAWKCFTLINNNELFATTLIKGYAEVWLLLNQEGDSGGIRGKPGDSWSGTTGAEVNWRDGGEQCEKQITLQFILCWFTMKACGLKAEAQ